MMRPALVAWLGAALVAACDAGSVPLFDGPAPDHAACAPRLVASPSALSFGPTPLNTQLNQTVTVSSSGSCSTLPLSVVVVGTDAATYVVSSSSCTGLALAPAASCVVDVRFMPGTPGTSSAMLRLGDGTVTLDVGLDGTAIGEALLSIQPSSRNLGSSSVGVASAPGTFTLTNQGAPTITGLGAILVGADSTDFAITRNTCPASLASAATCQIDVVMTPLSTGTKTATVVVTSSQLTLTGTVTGTGLTSPGISLTPAVRDFGNVIVGQTARSTFTVTNVGTSATGALANTLSGPDAAQFRIAATGAGFSVPLGVTGVSP